MYIFSEISYDIKMTVMAIFKEACFCKKPTYLKKSNKIKIIKKRGE